MGVLQLFEPFYMAAERRGAPAVGDIYWVPIPHTEQTPRIFDVKRSDSRDHTVLDYEIVEIRNHHFTERTDRLPIKLLTLGATEELVIAKAKKRPAVVLFSSALTDMATLSALDQRLAKDIAKPCYVVAPMYSPATPSSPGPFMPTLVARIRALQYPHLACLPPLGKNTQDAGEIVRLDRLHATHLARGCERSEWKLHVDVTQLIVDQLLWAAHGSVSEYLEAAVETVRDSLPPELV